MAFRPAAMMLLAGTMLGLIEVYSRVRQRTWLRDEIALLPFPPKH